MMLTTPRLHLRPTPTDEASMREIVGWLSNAETIRYSEQRWQHHTISTQLEYIRSLAEQDVYLAIYCAQIMIGTISAHIDPYNQIANVGILIGDASTWGKGFGNEAWKAFCDSLLKESGYRKVEAGCMACNVAMMSICSHYGMMEEGRQDDHFLCRGVAVDLVHWGKFK